VQVYYEGIFDLLHHLSLNYMFNIISTPTFSLARKVHRRYLVLAQSLHRVDLIVRPFSDHVYLSEAPATDNFYNVKIIFRYFGIRPEHVMSPL
jgi:hypothetical protein